MIVGPKRSTSNQLTETGEGNSYPKDLQSNALHRICLIYANNALKFTSLHNYGYLQDYFVGLEEMPNNSWTIQEVTATIYHSLIK